MPDVIVFISVDTEEDNWGDYACRTPKVTNIGKLPGFQFLCDKYGAIPTYLANWPTVEQDSSRGVLRELLQEGRCEIGTHIHPWNTPPIEEEVGERASMLSNLPAPLAGRKLSSLHSLMGERLGHSPVSFRAGRWGFNAAAAQTLLDLGYTVDSSVSPWIDWTSEHGPDYRKAPSQAYRFHPESPLTPDPAGSMVEIPTSIGFLGGHPEVGMALRAWAMRPVPRHLKMVGLLDRLRVAALRWLSPEVATGREMTRLARVLVDSGAKFLNFTFHSPTLVPGLTPFVENEDQLGEFMDRIEVFLAWAKGQGYQFTPLNQGPRALGIGQ